jgi:hypothetical protein
VLKYNDGQVYELNLYSWDVITYASLICYTALATAGMLGLEIKDTLHASNYKRNLSDSSQK